MFWICLFLLFVSYVLDLTLFFFYCLWFCSIRVDASYATLVVRRVVGCNLLHHFIFGKNVCFCNCFVCFGFVCFCYLSRLFRIVLFLSFYCLGFCFTIAVIDCALLVINSAIVTSSFTLRKIRFAHIKKEKKYEKEKEISLGIRTLRVHYAPLGHFLRSKHLQALGLYAHIAHNRNVVAWIYIELLNFRSKFLGLVPENLCTKILTNSNW